MNRVLPELFTTPTRRSSSRCGGRRRPTCSATGPGPGATAVLDAARLAVSMRRSRSGHLAHLREQVDLPLLLIPYLFVRDHGLRVTRMVAEALGQELG